MTAARELFAKPGFDCAETARADLESGAVDQRLVDALAAIAERHAIFVSVIKTGHPMGPTSPAGRENDHFYFRAADITHVDGVALDDAPAAVSVGRLLMALEGDARPARVMGPAAWLAALGEGDRTGFRDDAHATAVHADHLHIGF